MYTRQRYWYFNGRSEPKDFLASNLSLFLPEKGRSESKKGEEFCKLWNAMCSRFLQENCTFTNGMLFVQKLITCGFGSNVYSTSLISFRRMHSG